MLECKLRYLLKAIEVGNSNRLLAERGKLTRPYKSSAYDGIAYFYWSNHSYFWFIRGQDLVSERKNTGKKIENKMSLVPFGCDESIFL